MKLLGKNRRRASGSMAKQRALRLDTKKKKKKKSRKGKTDKSDFTKIENFCFVENLAKRIKRQATDWMKRSAKYLTKD